MTGTAKTEEQEFQAIYDLDVVEIPTNKPLARKDLNDIVYTNQKAKFNAVVNEIVEVHKTGRPILVGTISVEKSEMLSHMLDMRGIKHEVLNAKLPRPGRRRLVAQAGKYGNVTIATNMAGRGTDILLGGNAGFPCTPGAAPGRHGGESWWRRRPSHTPTRDDEEILAARGRYADAYARYKADTDAEHESEW